MVHGTGAADLTVANRSQDGTEAVLGIQYAYSGGAGVTARIIALVSQEGNPESARWFSHDPITVVRGQGRLQVSVRFREDLPDAPREITTDRVTIRILNSTNNVILSSTPFPVRLQWGKSASGSPELAPSSAAGPAEEVESLESNLAWDEPEEAQLKPEEPRRHGILRRAWTASKSWFRKEKHLPPREIGEAISAEDGNAAPEAMPEPVASAEPETETPALAYTGRAESPAEEKADDQARQPHPALDTEEENNAAPGNLSVPPHPSLAAWQERFTLGPADLLAISLVGEEPATRKQVLVGPDGRIHYLEAHNILAAGLTVDELRSALNEELAKTRLAAQAVVTPIAFRSKKYFLLGNVATKGIFTLEQPLTILQAVARAGGFEAALTAGDVLDLVDFSRSFLVRAGERHAVDLERLFEQGDLSQNIPLHPGDYLYFAVRQVQEVYVLGEINRPGAVPIAGPVSSVGAIAAAGGFTDRAWTRRVLVIRGSLKSPQTFVVDLRAVLASQAPDFTLQPKDIIFASHRPWVKAEELLDAATTAFVQAAIVTWVGADVSPLIR